MTADRTRARGGPSARARIVGAALIVASFAVVACRQDMFNQPKVKPLSESEFFADRQAARPLPPGTVPRGFLRADRLFYTGTTADGRMAAILPFPVTRQILWRGQERYNVFCSPCHDRAGTGRGMIVRRGFKQPPSFHIDRLREAPIGYFFDVETNGFGQMPSYAAQVPPEDRWAIVAYIRALQFAQHVRLAELPPPDRRQLEEAAAK